MGKASQSTSFGTSASEAIFSMNGKLRKRIPNFETTVVDTSDQVLVFPPDQESSDFDIPVVLESVSEIGSESGNIIKTPVRFGRALVGLIIVLTFSWSVYSLFFSLKNEKDDLAEIDSLPAVTTYSTSKQTTVVQLEQLSEKLLTNTTWSTDDVNRFLESWNQLSEEEINQAVKQSWYQMLEFNVKKHLNEQQDLSGKIQAANKKAQPLYTLALVMGVLEQPAAKITSSRDSNNYSKLLTELTNDLKQADKNSRAAARTEESESALNARLRKKYALVDQSISTANMANAENKSSKQNKIDVTTSKISKISKNDIETIVASYKDAYVRGDMKLMAKLFGASNKNSSVYDSVQNNFDFTFNNTVNRSLNIYDLHTDSTGDTAVINSKFNASVEFKNGKGTQYTVAKLKLLISKSNDQLIINRVDILDRKVNVVANERQQMTSSNGMLAALNNKIDVPTAAELQDVTTQLVTAYETGDLARFISLFSPDIKTNDRIDLEGVKQDYSQLFTTTSDRQMFIQNLNWTNETIGAKGTGDLEVIILSDEGKTVYSMEGKIQIVAQKIDQKVKITHLYHIERAK